MTTFENTEQDCVDEIVDETQVELLSRLRRMADEVEHLQSEIAAVEAFITDPATGATRAQRALNSGRPGASWQPTPTPQPWLEARSA